MPSGPRTRRVIRPRMGPTGPENTGGRFRPVGRRRPGARTAPPSPRRRHAAGRRTRRPRARTNGPNASSSVSACSTGCRAPRCSGRECSSRRILAPGRNVRATRSLINVQRYPRRGTHPCPTSSTPSPRRAWSCRTALVMAPLTRNRADAGMVPGDLAVEYYAQRASAGLIITEGTQPSAGRPGLPRPPPASTPPSRSPAGAASPTPCTREAAASSPSSCTRAGSRTPTTRPASEIVAPSAARGPGRDVHRRRPEAVPGPARDRHSTRSPAWSRSTCTPPATPSRPAWTASRCTPPTAT